MIKNKSNVKFIITLCLLCILSTLCTLSSVIASKDEEETEEEYVSLYSENNAPEFYGMTKAIVQKGTNFDLNIAYLRIFAKDFEDGDLTSEIKVVSNNVDTSNIGQYEVKYEVTDSHNNKTEITVPVTVVDNHEGNYYERTVYSLPSNLSYMSITGPRGMGMDRQITGFMLQPGASLKMKLVSGSSASAKIYSRLAGCKQTINLTNEFQEITWSDVSTIFIGTPFNGLDTPSVIGIQIDADADIVEMPYYHYGDDEEAFRAYWSELELQTNGDTVGVIESEDICFYFLPTDTPEGFKGFGTIDQGLEFYHDLFTEYDELLGYSYDATEAWNQNVKMKYFVSGGGANNSTYAYFQNDQVVYAQNASPTSSAFSTGWAILHEIGHGYQGGGLKDDSGMGLLEVSNNILGHYAQTIGTTSDRMSGDWLGSISSLETSLNASRLQGTTFRSLGAKGKLYVLVNLLDTYDYKESYAYLASMTRKMYYEGTYSNYSLADRYVLTYHELYGVNVSSYFEAWGETISQEVKQIVKDDKTLVMLNDVINDDELTSSIQTDLGLEGKYSLVSPDDLEKYDLTTTLKVTINIDDFSNVKGKSLVLTDGINTYTKVIQSEEVTFEVKAGVYQLTVPVPKDNVYVYDSYVSVDCVNNEDNVYEINYEKNETDLLTLATELYLNGQAGSFAIIKFDPNNIIINSTGAATHWYFATTENYGYIQVLDENDQEVYMKEYKGSSRVTAVVDNIPYKVGYKLVVYHAEGHASDKFKVINKYTNTTPSNLTMVKGVNTFIIGKYGLYQTEGDYENYVSLIDEYAEKLKATFTEEQLNNKNEKTTEKSILLASIYQLEEKEKKEYLEKYSYMINGGSATLNTDTVTITEGSSANLYTLVKGTDAEDGTFDLNENNFKYDKINIQSIGTYLINYVLTDLDNNVTNGVLKLIVEAKKNNTTQTTKPTTTETKPTTTNKPTSNKNTTTNTSIGAIVDKNVEVIVSKVDEDNTQSIAGNNSSNSSNSSNSNSNTITSNSNSSILSNSNTDNSNLEEEAETSSDSGMDMYLWFLLLIPIVLMIIVACVTDKTEY